MRNTSLNHETPYQGFYHFTQDVEAKKSYTLSQSQQEVMESEAQDTGYGRFFFILILTLLGILSLELVFHFVISPQLLIEKIEITADGGISLSDQDILNIAGLKTKDYYFALKTEEIKQRLERYSGIKEAKVRKSFPNTLKIALLGRTAVAISLVPTKHGTIPVAFDSEGVVFQLGNSIHDWDLPIISGIRFPDVQLGMRLPEDILGFLADLKKIKSGRPDLYRLISELKIVKKNNANYEVLLFTALKGSRVRIRPELDEKLLQYILLIQDVVKQENILCENDELDFRTNNITYKIKEE